MRRTLFPCLCLSLVLFCLPATSRADITSLTLTGSLANDADVFSYSFTDMAAESYNFYTTSYAAGGFVPVLTLFSNSTGNVIGFGGGDGICTGSTAADSTTGLCNDASFAEMLAPGKYTLLLSEFPNVPTGTLSSPGFLAMGDTSFTGTNCNTPGGMFLEADVSPCVQRTAKYDVNISSAAAATPEPSSLALLFFPAVALFFVARRETAW